MGNLRKRKVSGRTLCSIAVLLVLAWGLYVMAPAKAGAETIKLGLIDMYTGGFAFSANSIKAGFEVAVEEENAAGGVGGKMIEVQTADMGTSTEKAITEVRRMVLDEGILFNTIGIHSGAAVAAAGLTKKMKCLINGGFATTKRLTGEAGSRYVSRANISTVGIGSTMAEYLKDKPEVKTLSTISPDYEYGQHLIADFKAHLAKVRPDIKILREEWPKLGTGDFTPHVTALQARIPDVIVGGLYGGDMLNFFKAAKEFGLDKQTRYFGHGMAMEIAPIKDVVPEGTWATIWYPFLEISSPQNDKFRKEFEKKAGTYPNDCAIIGYYAAKMLIEAMKRAGSAELEAVIDALSGLEFEAPTGMVRVRECDHMALTPFWVGVIKRDPSFPDGIGFVDVKRFPIEKLARTCEDVMKARGKQ